MSYKNSIVIIPARGGSKRFLNKNTALLGGIPLLVHSINYAKAYNIDKIIVTTNDPDIKEIALKNGVEVVDRPEELSGDLASTVSALKHVLETIKNTFENVILLQPTNPLRPATLLSKVYKIFTKGNYDSLITVTRNNDKLGRITNTKFIPFNYKQGQRSQDLEPLYAENGLLYITKAHLILEGKIVGEHNIPFIIDHPYANIDIDTEEDLKFATYILENHPNE